MERIIIKRIDVLSLAKPLILLSGSIGLIIGIIFSLLTIPISKTSVHSINGDIVSTVTEPITGSFNSILFAIAGMIFYCITIAIVIILIVMVFNLFLRITGGLKLEIEKDK